MTASSRTLQEILSVLKGAGGYVSGQQLGKRLGVSRAAVWKLIEELRRRGYRIEARAKKGYLLRSFPEALDSLAIKESLRAEILGRRIHIAREVDSTNSWAFREAMRGATEGEVFLAEAQRSGRGRMGRGWFSPPGKNIYLSVILKPKLPPGRVPLLGLCAAVAVAETLQGLGLRPEIKWPNDVLLDRRKVSGILAEARTEADRVIFVILGIGLNVNMAEEDLPEDLRGIATSVAIHLQRRFPRNVLVGELLGRLESLYLKLKEGRITEVLSRWEGYSPIKGREVAIEVFGDEIRGIVQGIDEDGALMLLTPQGPKRVVAGDLKVKGW